MSQSPKNLHPSVAKSLDFGTRWSPEDLGELNTIVHPDAVRSARPSRTRPTPQHPR